LTGQYSRGGSRAPA